MQVKLRQSLLKHTTPVRLIMLNLSFRALIFTSLLLLLTWELKVYTTPLELLALPPSAYAFDYLQIVFKCQNKKKDLSIAPVHLFALQCDCKSLLPFPIVFSHLRQNSGCHKHT